jgi:hypothetical protein
MGIAFSVCLDGNGLSVLPEDDSSVAPNCHTTVVDGNDML